MKYLFFLLMITIPSIANAEWMDCGLVTVDKVYVQASREDGGTHQNSLLIIPGNEKSAACENVTFAQLKNTEPAYDGVLSMALVAYTSGTKLRLVVNATGSGNTYQIEWVNFN
ncbi:hypothetical protein [Saccharophagus degradans]|uniref:Uncharacterized protein n=1 Tax=Saccharophagus degradans (strain 2-40 / ATCC 43961 / DSM 17024) TaxID=203122 RepID=Q21JQ6_SACD2|nr:hypothetical protein [Saccharophagus degradans]ABD79719.1 hypothetical protein Sde_0455 [Saccharophagus degradans 2-40]ABD81073.1 hypothetical protein Sde_1813 [Saccharophagus degradans 2-40]